MPVWRVAPSATKPSTYSAMARLLGRRLRLADHERLAVGLDQHVDLVDVDAVAVLAQAEGASGTAG